MKFAIIDIETTGLSPRHEKITEIAVYIHDGNEIIDSFSTLVNPGKTIPYRIVQMTGINNRMVKNAPRFYEVAKKIVELTEDAVLVGHNVRFDYAFIRQEFLNLGYEYRRKTLDTVKLARRLIPGKPSYSLGKLCASLGIDNHARHRAEGDALATVKLFELLLSIDPDAVTSNGDTTNPDPLTKHLLDGLPRETGVYYFHNATGEIIYVGKSTDIRERVRQHLSNNTTKKAVEMKNNIASVSYTRTGSELVALLLESDEIKKHRPFYNRSQLRSYFNYGLYSWYDDGGYLRLKITKIIDNTSPLYTYASLQEAREHLGAIADRFELCQKLTGLYDSAGACFYYQIHRCKGACVGKEPPESYNKRVEEAIENYRFHSPDFLIIDKGRTGEEKSIVMVSGGKYNGFGFVPVTVLEDSPHMADEFVTSYADNKEVRRIIISFLKKEKNLRIIKREKQGRNQ